MKFVLVLLVALPFATPVWLVRASESAREGESAIETLKSGIEAHPNDAVALFRDALQTRPAFRRPLFASPSNSPVLSRTY